MPRVDLTALPPERRAPAMDRAIHRAVRIPFDITILPLVRWTWFQLEEREHMVLQIEHHFVHDGWSISVILQELEDLYRAFALGKPSPLPPPPLQYAEFAVWQRRFLSGELLEHQLAYWTKLLHDRPEPLELPADRPRPEARTFEGDQIREILPFDLYNGIRAFGQRQGFSLFLFTLAAFDILMARLAGRSTVVLASGVANRRLREIEGMLGMVVNTILLRVDLTPELSFLDLLPRIRHQVLEAHEHQDTPLEKIVEALQPERRVGETPLARVLFSFHDSPVPDLELPDLSGRVVPFHNGTAKADLNVVGMPRAEQRLGRPAREDDNEMLMGWEFDTSLFDHTTVLRMMQQYRVLLRSALEAPETPIHALPLLAKAERHQVVEEWNDTSTDTAPDVLTTLFAHCVERPHLVALEEGSLHLTYGGLRNNAAALAQDLRQRGIGPEDRVPLRVPTSPEMVCAQLAILWTGAAYVPCDPTWPNERILQILEDCQAKVLLIDTQDAEGLQQAIQVTPTEPLQVRRRQILPSGAPRTERRLFELGGGGREGGGGRGDGRGSASFEHRPQEHLAGGADDVELHVGRSSGAHPARVSSQSLAYVLYTSGSTGKPKGVEIPRSGLANLVAWHRRRFPVQPGDGVGQMAGPAFDASVWDIWLALAAGATLHLATGDRRLSPPSMLDWMLDRRLVSLLLPTPMGEAVLRQPWPQTTALRSLFLGGDRLHANALGNGAPAPVVNAYGPTENSVVATVLPLGTAGQSTDPPIGRPIDGVQTHVLDPFLRPAAPGMHGELCLAGHSLARGYAGQPAATAQSFVPNAFATTPGERLYRTGDRVRTLADGRIDFLGRLDHQVKVRGFRIELGEIESVLVAHAEVQEAVVLPRQGNDGSTYLAAFLAGDDELNEEALATYLAERLPRYMVPAHFLVLPELPKNTSGKKDRKALMGMGLPEPRQTERPIRPRTPQEEMVAGIWAEVLGLDEVGIHQDFFDLGGHSLLATQVVTRLERSFGVELPLRLLFESPTVAGLAHHLEQGLTGEEPLPLVPLPQDAKAPLSFAQERLWFLQGLAPESPFYTVPLAWWLHGPLDVSRLADALARVVHRHQVLRTHFPTIDGQTLAVVEPFEPPSMPQVDLRRLPPERSQAIARRLATKLGHRPFDLARGPVLRLALLQTAGPEGGPSEETLLLFTVHHIVFDGWSMGVLLRELQTLYSAPENQPTTLPPLTVHYVDFAHWQRRWLTGATLERQVQWWREKLQGVDSLRLSTDHPRPPVPAFHGRRLERLIPRHREDALRTLAQHRGATLAMVLSAAVAHLLGRWANQDDVVLGAPIAGRTRPELEDLIGFFVNSLALRIPLDGDPTFEQLIDRCREMALGAYSHQDLPFEQLVEELHPERDLSRNPIFQVMSTLQNAPQPEMELADLRLALLPAEIHTTHFDLEINFWHHDEGLRCVIGWDRSLFDPSTLERLAHRLEALLEGVAQAPTTPLSHLDLLTPGERHQVLHELADAQAPWPQQAGLFDLFEAQAQRHPEAPATLDGRPGEAEVLVDYGTLYRKANALAHRLRELGLGDESLVAVLLERGPDLAWIFPGILAAEGAYLPLDTTHPPGRLRAMLHDAGARVLITDGAADPRLLQEVDHVFHLDDLREAEATTPPPRTAAAGERLAYVLYTSGSTGRPKGVAVVQRAISRLVLGTNYVRLQRDDRIAQVSNASFDAATFEFWGALLTGAALVHVPTDVLLTPRLLGRTLDERGVTVLSLTMGPFHKAAEEAPQIFAGLRCLLFGAEAADAARVAAVRSAMDAGQKGRLVHLYGPTESTSFATWQPVDTAPEPGRNLPIGRPLTNTTVRLLDDSLEPTPLGALGGLYLGGAGLARAYWKRPALTAQAFVPDPHGGPGERLYTTGDLARRTASGVLQFFGRADQQVKVRGFRLEPGEVEVVLEEHAAVARAVVLPYPFESEAADRSLAAWLVPDATYEAQASSGQSESAEQVEQWQILFDDAYGGEGRGAEPTFNIVGWNRTADGEPIPAEEMRAWLEDTARGILRLEPRRLLEIGCGTGMVLFRVAPHVEHYTATDISRRGLHFIDAVRQSLDDPLPHAELHLAGAHELQTLPSGTYDTMVLNSVVQYFPGAEYLVEVIEGVLPRVAPGGRLFLGDLRSLPLFEHLHAQIALERAADDDSPATLRRRIAGALIEEDELLVHPHFFHALVRRLPRPVRVEILPKEEPRGGELGAYRYQVVLHFDAEPWPALPALSWRREGLTLAGLRRHLRQAQGPLALEGIPNRRLDTAQRLHDALRDPEGPRSAAELRVHLDTAPAGGIEPMDLVEAAAELGFHCTLAWNHHGTDGHFDALLWPEGEERPQAVPTPQPQDLDGPLGRWTNRPTRGRFARRVLPQIRTFLEDRLPDYMVPRSFALLDTLPLTPNGKLDRGALPEPELGRSTVGSADLTAPRNATEEQLAHIWSKVLDRDRVGVDEDFFDLGGHSLLATRVVAEVRKELGEELELRTLFENPTIAGLAHHLGGEATRSRRPPLLPQPRPERLPLSFAQQRLWFLENLDPGVASYNFPLLFDLRGPLDLPRFEAALTALVRRHEILRTRYPVVEGEPQQVIDPAGPVGVSVVDLRHLPDTEAQGIALAQKEARRPFDLAHGPVLRPWLARVAKEHSILLLAFHHIAIDGGSLPVLLRELDALYRGQPLPPLPVHYADFALWQNGWLVHDTRDQLFRWWREQLEQPPTFELPTDRPRPSERRFHGRRLRRSHGLPQRRALETFARRRGATPFQVTLAAFFTLLHRLTGQTDLLLGSPIAGRNAPGLEALIGFFVNTLALRARVHGSESFEDLLERVVATTLGAYDHQDVPFESLVESLEVERDLSRNPLFQLMFAHQGVFPTEPSVGDLRLAPRPSGIETARFDLELDLWQMGEQLEAVATFDTDLFDTTTVERLMRSYGLLLTGALETPDLTLDELLLLPAAERHQVVVEARDTRRAFPDALGLAELTRRAAEPRTEAIATVFGDHLSYGELLRRSTRLAGQLSAAGVGLETLVGVALPRSTNLPIVLLAILQAGGAYLPLDSEYPEERLRFMVDDAKPRVLLAGPEEQEHFADSGVPVWTVEHGAVEGPEVGTTVDAHGGHLAYVIYTSGSTGQPKGVLIEQRSVARLVLETNYIQLRTGHRIAQVSNTSFDAATFELWGALLHGACLVGLEQDDLLQTQNLGQRLAEERIDVLSLTMVLFHQVARESPRAFGGLEHLLFGAEAADPRHVARMRESIDARMVHLYGPTECTGFATWHEVHHPQPHQPLPIGRALNNTDVLVVDRSLRPVPLGALGELCLGGPGLARGYLQRPAASAERFVPHPFGGPGERLYRTGDLARQSGDGRIQFRGRIDHQVKIRGFRIEPGEVEAALGQHPQVAEVLVLVRDTAAGPSLVAHAVSESASPDALRTFLKSRLPGHLVPAFVLVLDELPVTPNGKIDRAALLHLDLEPDVGVAETAPRDAREEILAGLWAEVLGRGEVGVHQSFFELGGHSLLATRLMARVEQAFEQQLPLRTLFEEPTVAGMARLLAEDTAERRPALLPRTQEGLLPLSFGQQRLWFLESLEPEQSLYNFPLIWNLEGPLDPGTLAAALTALLRRHEVLRTRFPLEGREPIQVIDPPYPVPLPVVDLQNLEDASSLSLALAQQETRYPFDLAQGPALRARLFRFTDECWTFVLVFHHIVIDGGSLDVLQRDLRTAYAGHPLPPLDLHYADFTLWQRDWLRDEVLDQRIGWWRQQLADPPDFELPTDRPRRPVRRSHGRRLHLALRVPEVEILERFARQRGATLFVTLLTAFQALLHRLSQRQDILLGSPIAGRNAPGLEGLIGFFVNTLALRARVHGGENFDSLLARSLRAALGAYDHQDVPFETLVEHLEVGRDLSRNPLFQILFALQETPEGAQALGSISMEPQKLGTQTARFDLEFDLWRRDGQLEAVINFDTDLFDATTVERLGRSYALLLTGAIEAPDLHIEELPLLPVAERHQLLVEARDTHSPFPDALGLAELTRRAAEPRTEAIAAVFGDHLSYGELLRRATRLAGQLSAAGVGPETLAGVALPRSTDLPIVLLAILQAGGAYLPLDSEYPEERLRFMVDDAKPRVLLASPKNQEHFADSGVPVWTVDKGAVEGPEAGTTVDPHGGHLAYVIYTSGSTGQPKGVLIEQRSVARLVLETNYIQLHPEHRIAQVSNTSFDAATFELWGALLHGACLVGLEQDDLLQTQALGQRLAEQRVDVLSLTMVLFHQVARENPQAFGGLEHLLFGAEAADPRHVAQMRKSIAAHMVHLYGPTECTGFATWHAVRHPRPHEPLPIGRALANTDVLVVDRSLRPVPLGALGELCLGGAGLARGYLHRPASSAERFVPHPLGDPGERLYRTGDLARQSRDGRIQFRGRIDHQVKIRGFRVEPGEVEAVLGQHPQVAEALVLVRDTPTGPALVAHAVCNNVPGTTPNNVPGTTPDDLRRFLESRLPRHLVPAFVLVIDELPVTPNGKIDRAALLQLDLTHEETAGPAPRDPREEIVAGIWAEILGRESVSISQDFFDLGGHSLLATQVMAQVQQTFGVELPLRTLFEHSTVEGLASAIGGALAEVDAPQPPPPLERLAADRDRFPASFSQLREWVLDRLHPESTAFNIASPLRLRGPLHLQAFHRALVHLQHRHAALRTTLVEQGGEPLQVVHPAPRHGAPLVDLCGLAPIHRERALQQLVDREAQTPFHLEHGPLLRTALAQLDPHDHVWLLSFHHSIVDGWSLGIFFRELDHLYRGFVEGQSDLEALAPLPELPLRYGDFAAWQRSWLTGQVLDHKITFWRQQLDGSPPLLELPTDRPRPEVRSTLAASFPLLFSAEQTQAAEALARAHRASLFMVLLTSLAALLQRITHSTDFNLGTFIASRTRREVADMVGFFTNTLVLRALPVSTESAADHLDQIRDTTLAAFAHQDLPFELLLEHLDVERTLRHSPLFQVMLSLHNLPQGEPSLGNLEVKHVGSSRRQADFDLELNLHPQGDGLLAEVKYSTELFDSTTMLRLAQAWHRLLDAMVQNPSQPLAELPVLDRPQRHQLLVEGQGEQVPVQILTGLHQALALQAEATPEALAIEGPQGESVPYGQLLHSVRRLAHRLRRHGVGPETLVALTVPPGPTMVIALFAVLEAGGAYLPLDPDQPAERLTFVLRDAGAHLLLGTAGQAALETAEHAGTSALEIDDELTASANESTDPLPGHPHPEQLAYVLYTSGTTGEPKGVPVPHRALLHFLAVADSTYAFRPGDRVLQFAALTFDTSVEEIFPSLCRGATLVFTPGPRLKTPRDFLQHAHDRALTVIDLPTAYWHELMAEPEFALPLSTRLLIVGGEKARAEGLDPWRRRVPSTVRLFNGYGPSEATVMAIGCDLAGPHAVSAPDIEPPIGRPLVGCGVVLVDRGMRPVPRGARGEITLGGRGLARGYLGRPALTAQHFVPHPFAQELGERLYTTGDAARLRADGNLEFLGRIDDQVKLRGQRVEPREVEALLAQHPAVREVAVVARPLPSGDLGLVAWIVPEGELPEAALREHLRTRLPAFMVPSAFLPLEVLPKNRNLKVDRKDLTSRDLPQDLRPDIAADGFRTPEEELLANLWREVLGLSSLGREDNFFELGGHSLLATRVVARVREVFGVELPLLALFEQSTVATLAPRIAEAARSRRVPPISRRDPGIEELPLSYSQRRLWFLDRLNPDNPFYNIPFSWILRGPLNKQALRAAIHQIVRRHESFRTRFLDRDGDPRQIVEEHRPPRWNEVDLTPLGTERARDLIGELVRGLAFESFHLGRDPLLRVQLVHVAPQETVLLVTQHHIISDGWSLGVFQRELRDLYAAFTACKPSPLPDLPLQYPDFALWQRSWLTGEALDEQLHWWGERLADVEPLQLPTDRPRPEVAGFRGRWLPVRIDAPTVAGLERLAQHRGATLYMVLLAAVDLFLARTARQNDIVTGSPIAGRHVPEVEPLIGFFVNSLALRLSLGGAPTFEALVDRARSTALGAYAHQDLPFEQLVEHLHPERDLSRNPLFQVMMALHNAPPGRLALEGLELEVFPFEMRTGLFDLELNFLPFEDPKSGTRGLHSVLTGDRDLFDHTTLDRFGNRLARLLRSVADAPQQLLSQVNDLDPAERHQLLFEWNNAEAKGPWVESLATLAERHAESEGIAFLSGRPGEPEEGFSHAELHRRANRLAHRLRHFGAGEDRLVVLLLERSADLFVALLATLKADAAYLPLDPSYPAGRLRAMLRDAQPAVLLRDGSGPDELGVELPTLHLGEDLADEPITPPERTTDGHSLAYVMFTSGSTGRPKGVAIRHRAIARLALESNYLRLESRHRIAQVSNSSFDAATFEYWAALLTGAALVHVPTDILLSPRLLGRMITERGITTLSLTMGPFHQAAEEAPEIFAPLEHLLFGAEAADPGRVRMVRQAMDQGQGGRLVHLYGPTESTSFASYHLIQHLEESTRALHIGRPLANTRVHLLDPTLDPAPLGAPGELCLAGQGLARGYWNRPALTAERFVPDPHAPHPGARLYRTGDLARRLPAGEILFLGRADQQVKVRGFRIEPGEIETLLEEHPAVARAVVRPQPTPSGEERLVAWLVQDEANTLEAPGDEDWQGDQVEQWQILFDDAYSAEARADLDPTFHIAGWNRTADGTPHPSRRDAGMARRHRRHRASPQAPADAGNRLRHRPGALPRSAPHRALRGHRHRPPRPGVHRDPTPPPWRSAPSAPRTARRPPTRRPRRRALRHRGAQLRGPILPQRRVPGGGHRSVPAVDRTRRHFHPGRHPQPASLGDVPRRGRPRTSRSRRHLRRATSPHPHRHGGGRRAAARSPLLPRPRPAPAAPHPSGDAPQGGPPPERTHPLPLSGGAAF